MWREIIVKLHISNSVPTRKATSSALCKVLAGALLALMACPAWCAVPSREDEMSRVLVARKGMSADSDYLDITAGQTPDKTTQSGSPAALTEVVGDCGRQKSCSAWVLSGELGTIQELSRLWQSAINQYGGFPQTIVLDSSGGDASGGLWLAEKFQKLKINTRVEGWGVCQSACVYVLAAGYTRTIDPWALVEVHAQNASKDVTEGAFRNEAMSKPYLANILAGSPEGSVGFRLPIQVVRDVVDNVSRSTQYRDAHLALLMEQAGISPLLLTYMAMTPNTQKGEPMRVLNLPCVQALGLDSQSGALRRRSVGQIQEKCGSITFTHVAP